MGGGRGRREIGLGIFYERKGEASQNIKHYFAPVLSGDLIVTGVFFLRELAVK